MDQQLLLTPGPTKVPAELCVSLGLPLIHHRTAEFQRYLKESIEGIQYILQTTNDVYMITSSGTGAMEASVCSLVSAGNKVITVEGGKFGERWTELARAFQAEPIIIDVEWGRAVKVGEIESALAKNPSVKAVFLTLCETSTGAMPDIEAIADVVMKTDAVLVVDAISGLGVIDFKMDEWGVDVVAGACHKGLMLPPGVAFVAMSDKAKGLMRQSRASKFYFDLRKYEQSAGKPDTPFTPAINIVVALSKSVKRFQDKGLDVVFGEYGRLAQGLRQAVSALGLKIFTHESARCNVLTAIEMPSGIDSLMVAEIMCSQYGVTVAGGQGQLKSKIIRIGHMGCLDDGDMLKGIDALERALMELGYQIEIGVGLAAAKDYFSRY